MKLNKVLALAGLALVVVGLPLMAAPAVLTGDVTGGWITDFSNHAAAGPGFDLYVNAKIDDFNTAYANVGLSAPATLPLAAAYLTSDVGKFLKMDAKTFGWTVTAGYTSAGDNSYASQTAYGLEDVTVATTATDWMFSTTLSFASLINVKLGVAPATLSSASTKDFIGGVYLAPALGTVGKLNLEAFYDSNITTDGSIYADARFDLTAVKGLTVGIGAGMSYALTGGGLGIAASAKAAVSMGNLAVGFITGTATGASTLLGVSAQITPVAGLNIYAAGKLDLTSGAASAFHSADVAASVGIGATTVYVGYLIAGSSTVAPAAVWAPAANTDGGLYVKATVSF